ncbi:MAG: hypothetical protein QXV83_00725 [Candidatus Anstonellaceae archaeon]
MEDIKALKELMETKTKEKIEVLKELRKTNLQIKKLIEELKNKTPKDKKTNPDLISKKIEKLEFYISTSAFTPAQEREALRKIAELKKELNSSLQNKAEWEEVKRLKKLIKEERGKKLEIKKKLTDLIKELDEIYKKIINYSIGSKQKRQKKQLKEEGGEKKELEGKIESEKEEGYLTLEDILKLSQKEQKKE